MNIELKYKEALEEYNLQENDLPEDAQTGIDIITSSIKAVNRQKNIGRKVSNKAIKKIQTMDKWVYFEILDYVHDKDDNNEMPHDEDEIIEEIEENSQEEMKESKSNNSNANKNVDAKKIELELEALHKTGKNQFSFDELKKMASKCYDLIFDTYDEGDENGIVTSNYSLLESNPQVFILKKK